MLKIGILGAAGRMGQMIAREIISGGTATLAAAIEQDGNPLLGRDIGDVLALGAKGVKICKDAATAFTSADIIIDFSSKDSAAAHARLAAQHKKPLVIGTTGLAEQDFASLKTAGQSAPILYSANMSMGIGILSGIIEETAKKLGPDYDIEIFEAHHRHKADAPSGTSLLLARAAAKGRGVNLDDVLVTDRKGSRKPGTIGVSVFRGGDIAGDHTVTFAGPGERIEFTHRAADRSLFAKGAIKAALWLQGKPAGFYSLRDILRG